MVCIEDVMRIISIVGVAFDDASSRHYRSNGGNMATKIFVNLPVKNLNRSVEFFTKLGFTFNPQFTDETATCMIVAEDKFKSFTPKKIRDATKSTEVLVSLTSESREKVDGIVRKAVAAGGTTYNEPHDHGFMYGHGFQDLDGHIWEIIFMEPSAKFTNPEISLDNERVFFVIAVTPPVICAAVTALRL